MGRNCVQRRRISFYQDKASSVLLNFPSCCPDHAGKGMTLGELTCVYIGVQNNFYASRDGSSTYVCNYRHSDKIMRVTYER